MKNCFQIYFQPIYLYVKKILNLAFDNDSTVLMTTATAATTIQILQDFLNINYFGVSNLTLLLVMCTILIDAYYGVKKSLKESYEAKKSHDEILEDTPEKRAFYKIYLLKKFKPGKLQYTFFKALTLLGYLFFVKNILIEDSEGDLMTAIIGFSSTIVLKAPIIIFWYYDFKSIGENTEYIYEKKAPIFVIVEKIFEPKLSSFFNIKKNEDVF
jgi:hypothetical protein